MTRKLTIEIDLPETHQRSNEIGEILSKLGLRFAARGPQSPYEDGDVYCDGREIGTWTITDGEPGICPGCYEEQSPVYGEIVGVKLGLICERHRGPHFERSAS